MCFYVERHREWFSNPYVVIYLTKHHHHQLLYSLTSLEIGKSKSVFFTVFLTDNLRYCVRPVYREKQDPCFRLKDSFRRGLFNYLWIRSLKVYSRMHAESWHKYGYKNTVSTHKCTVYLILNCRSCHTFLYPYLPFKNDW
jgi:hypothetical protein